MNMTSARVHLFQLIVTSWPGLQNHILLILMVRELKIRILQIHVSTVFTEIINDTYYVICKVCPNCNTKKPIHHCHVPNHVQSKVHQRNIRSLAKMKEQWKPLRLETPKYSGPMLSQALQDPWEVMQTIQPDLTLPPFPVTNKDSEVPLGQLWDEFQAEHTILVDDYFNELQWKIKSSESILSIVLSPLQDELGLKESIDIDPIPPNFEEMCEDFGINVDGSSFP